MESALSGGGGGKAGGRWLSNIIPSFFLNYPLEHLWQHYFVAIKYSQHSKKETYENVFHKDFIP